jgi:hypothetical protein
MRAKKLFLTFWLFSTIFLFSLPFTASAQTETVEIEPDQYTVVLDHFNGSCKENCRYIGYVNSLPGLDRAANFTGNAYSIYQIPWHLCGPINGQGTIEMWVRLRHYEMRLVSGHSNNNAGPTYMVLYVRKDGRLGYYVWPTGTTPLVNSSPIPLLEWTHIAVTWGPRGTKIYVNGKLDAEIDTNFSQRTCTYMGHHYHLGKGKADIGLIDEFHISHTQRSADEIARHGTYRDVVPRLTLGVPVSDQVSGAQSRLYKVTTQPDKDLLVTLEQTGTPAGLAFYSRRDNFPSPLRYDSYDPRQTGKARQAFIFPAAFQPQTYYFLIRSTAPRSDSTGFTILARHPALYVEEVSPASAGNAGSVTLSIRGCQFSGDVEVTLISPSGASIGGSPPILFDGTTLYSTFDLTGTATGKYDVKIAKPEADPITLAEALDVIPGIGPRLKVRLKAPTIIRSRRPYTMWVEYENSGDADATAPLFQLNHSAGSEIQIGTSKRKSAQELYLLGVSTSGPAGVLPPGSSHKIPITFTSLSGDMVKFDIKKYRPDATPVQWDDIKTALRPPLLDDDEWTDYWNRATSSMGETWQEVIDGLPPGIGGTGTKLEYSADLTALLQYTLGLNELAAQEASASPLSREPALMRSTNQAANVDVSWIYGFDPDYNCTYIVTHGWRSSYRDMLPLAHEIKKHCPECNVGLVNWEVPASGPIYNPWGVAGNIPGAAKAVYDKLKEEVGDYNFSKMTYVGHSFGNALNKHVADYEKTGDGKLRGKMVALDPPHRLGGGEHGQPDFAGSFEKESTSYSSTHFADAKPCESGRIADKQYYLEDSSSHSGALDCLEKVLENTPETDCSDDWLNGSQSIPPAGGSPFDGRVDCEGNHYPNPVDPCPEDHKPTVPWKPGPSAVSYIFRAADPNEKVGTLGTGEPDYFIRPGTEITYTVYFENKPSATAPAQEVFIDDRLDSDLDWSSLQLGEIAFGDRVITALCGRPSGFTSVMKDGYRVDIEVLFDPDSGSLNWTFRTLDPVTNLWPEDPLAGFLPPNDPETGSGEGHVTFTVRTRADLADGTEVTNMAGIVFDTEPRIDTNTWKNVINSQIVVNRPPQADAGDDVTVKSEKMAQTVIQGSAEDEDADDPLEYCWKEGDTLIQAFTPVGENNACPLDCSSLSLALGSHTLTLEVTDGTETAADDMVLTIENSPPRATAEGSGQYEINTPVSLKGTASDFDGDALDYRWLEGTTVFAGGTVQAAAGGAPVDIPELSLADLGLGTHTIVLTLTDKVNEPVSAEVTVEVVDTTPPTLSPVADRVSLWPPNHKLKKIYIKSNVSDNSGLPVTLTVKVSSSEPVDGLGDGDRAPDWTEPVIKQAAGVVKLKLRAERSGKGTGRVYTVTVTATDRAGNSSRAAVDITVPHDKGKQEKGR